MDLKKRLKRLELLGRARKEPELMSDTELQQRAQRCIERIRQRRKEALAFAALSPEEKLPVLLNELAQERANVTPKGKDGSDDMAWLRLQSLRLDCLIQQISEVKSQIEDVAATAHLI